MSNKIKQPENSGDEQAKKTNTIRKLKFTDFEDWSVIKGGRPDLIRSDGTTYRLLPDGQVIVGKIAQ